LESQLLHRLLNRRHVALVGAVDEDVPLRRDDEERGEALGSDVVDVADDLVRREWGRHVVGAADVAPEQRLLGEGVSAYGNGRPGLLAAAAARRLIPLRRRGGKQCEQRHCERFDTVHVFLNAALIRSAVKGTSRTRTPVASKIALPTAAATIVIAVSPAPLASASVRLISTLSMIGTSNPSGSVR